MKSFIDAINWAVAPKNIAHGKTKDTPEVNPSFWDEATNVIIANPKSPNAEGSAVTTLTFVSLFIVKPPIKYINNVFCIQSLIYNTKKFDLGI